MRVSNISVMAEINPSAITARNSTLSEKVDRDVCNKYPSPTCEPKSSDTVTAPTAIASENRSVGRMSSHIRGSAYLRINRPCDSLIE